MERKDKKEVDRRVLIAGIGGAVAGSLLVGGRATASGGLNPAPGPPAPTGKSSSELARMITSSDLGCAQPPTPIESLPGSATADHCIVGPGSYYQMGNLIGSPGKNPLEIHANNVDFCGGGFHIFVTADPGGTTLGVGVLCDGENVSMYDVSVIGGSVGVDFSAATGFILWDVTVFRALSACFRVGSNGNCYDSEAHQCPGVGFLAEGSHTLLEEGSAFSCGTGFLCTGSQNMLLANFATNCQTPFSFGPGNSYGPICNVAGMGDISSNPLTHHHGANFAH